MMMLLRLIIYIYEMNWSIFCLFAGKILEGYDHPWILVIDKALLGTNLFLHHFVFMLLTLTGG